MPLRPLCYVAGPFRHDSPTQMAAHIVTAKAAAVTLANRGWSPYVPHANLGHAFGQIPETDAEAINDTFLQLCQALLLLPGWEHSVGATREHDMATRAGLPIFYYPEVPCHQ
jgi:hypothetical protein